MLLVCNPMCVFTLANCGYRDTAIHREEAPVGKLEGQFCTPVSDGKNDHQSPH